MSELLQINVNGHTEKKNGLTYLSWAWAWAEVLKIDPEAQWFANEYGPQGSEVPYMQLPDGSCMVKVTVTIKGKHKSCLLPVMNHRNQAIKGPDAFAVNTAIMRCMTKAISMHGLGLYIYAGEDLPEGSGDPPTPKPGPEPDPVKSVVIKPVPAIQLDPNAEARVQEMVSEIVLSYQDGRELDCIEIWKNHFADNDEKTRAWALLAKYSEIRAFLKANKPQLQTA